MIISHKYKFIFIKTQKTAGTSIEVYLSQFCGDHDVLTPNFPPEPDHAPRNHTGLFNPLPEVWPRFAHNVRDSLWWLRGRPSDHIGRRLARASYRLVRGSGGALVRPLDDLKNRRRFSGHFAAWIIKSRLSKEVWDSYFKFCVERNPWDKVLSLYYFRRHQSGGALTWDEFLSSGRFARNFPLYVDPVRERVLVDRICYYESLNQDLSSVFRRLGIPFDGTLPVRAKAGHRPERSSYRDVLSERDRAQIARTHAAEIDMHGYRF